MERTDYLAGLMVQMKVAGNISVETNMSDKPLRAGFSVRTWQFPVLAEL